jgi:hypothetical protein
LAKAAATGPDEQNPVIALVSSSLYSAIQVVPTEYLEKFSHILYGRITARPNGGVERDGIADDERERLLGAVYGALKSAGTDELRDLYARLVAAPEIRPSTKRREWKPSGRYAFGGELKELPSVAPRLWKNSKDSFADITDFVATTYAGLIGFGFTRSTLDDLDAVALSALRDFERAHEVRWLSLPTEAEHNSALIEWLHQNPDLANQKLPGDELARLRRLAGRRAATKVEPTNLSP